MDVSTPLQGDYLHHFAALANSRTWRQAMAAFVTLLLFVLAGQQAARADVHVTSGLTINSATQTVSATVCRDPGPGSSIVNVVTFIVTEPTATWEFLFSPVKLFSQILYDYQEATLSNANPCATLTAKLPTQGNNICAYQADVYAGPVVRNWLGAFYNGPWPGSPIDGVAFLGHEFTPVSEITEADLLACSPAITTVTQGGYGAAPHGNNPAAYLAANFPTTFPHGVSIGGHFLLTFDSAQAIQHFLPQGGTPSILNASATDPTSSSAGVFAGQILALQLSVALHPSLGGLILVNTGTSLDGLHVADILIAANQVLGGDMTALPSGFTVSGLNDLLDTLNGSFEDYTPSAWALAHLSVGP